VDLFFDDPTMCVPDMTNLAAQLALGVDPADVLDACGDAADPIAIHRCATLLRAHLDLAGRDILEVHPWIAVTIVRRSRAGIEARSSPRLRPLTWRRGRGNAIRVEHERRGRGEARPSTEQRSPAWLFFALA
jgi:hypothetical protein